MPDAQDNLKDSTLELVEGGDMTSNLSEDEDDAEEIFEFEDTPELGAVEIEITDISIDATTFGVNLAEVLDTEILQQIGSDRQEVYQNLKNARGEWEEGIKRGIQWLGISTADESDDDVEGSCQATHPIMIENVVKFQAKAIQELWPAKGPVRTKIKGLVNEKSEQAAARVATFMNWQLTEKVPGFYNSLERNLFRVGFLGTGLRKAGWNSGTVSPDPTIVPIENFYVDPSVTHLSEADEYIEVMELSSRKMQNLLGSGQFYNCDDAEEVEESIQSNEVTDAISRAQGFDYGLERTGFLVGESHCYLDLDGADPLVPAGECAPYIVHFNLGSGKVYAIRRNWRKADIALNKRLWYTADQFIPAFGFYGLGFIHLLGNLTASATAALRALVDAGQLANWQGGFKSQDAKFSQPSDALGFGEWRDVNASPEDLQKAFLPLPAKEPSQTLLALLQFMVAAGQKFADATDEVAANGATYGTASTTLALLEASGRFYSSIHKRLHQSQGEFFRLIAELNYDNLPDKTNFVVNDENQYVGRDDFDPEMVNVVPSSDPNALSESARVARAQIELETAVRFPALHDMREALKRFYLALGTADLDKLLPDPEEKAVSADPLTEIQLAMQGKPIRARMGQAHQAHIAVKMAFLQSPQMQGTNDPTTVVGIGLLKSNVAEHRVLMFASQVMAAAEQMGLDPRDENIQGQIGEHILKVSAAEGGGGAGPSIEQQMLEVNKQELQLSAERIKSQDARENAKIQLKLAELGLKKQQLDMELEDSSTRNRMEASKIILDNQNQEAQTAVKHLAMRVQDDSTE